MTDKIKGVPEGWKIKRLDTARDGDFIPSKDSSGVPKAMKVEFTSGWVGLYTAILERDIKIIDMSKCEVDIEYATSGS